jgi:hypothetical protein
MKEFITPNYIFSPGASGVGFVNLLGIDQFDVARLVAIINQTRGILIYSTASSANKYTSVSGTTVYLNFDTSSQSSTDQLQIIYNNESSTIDMIVMLNNLLSIIANPGIRDKTINADRVTLAGGSTSITSGSLTSLTTVSTVSTVSNVAAVGGYQGQMQIIQNNINAWANACRRTIS